MLATQLHLLLQRRSVRAGAPSAPATTPTSRWLALCQARRRPACGADGARAVRGRGQSLGVRGRRHGEPVPGLGDRLGGGADGHRAVRLDAYDRRLLRAGDGYPGTEPQKAAMPEEARRVLALSDRRLGCVVSCTYHTS